MVGENLEDAIKKRLKGHDVHHVSEKVVGFRRGHAPPAVDLIFRVSGGLKWSCYPLKDTGMRSGFTDSRQPCRALRVDGFGMRCFMDCSPLETRSSGELSKSSILIGFVILQK